MEKQFKAFPGVNAADNESIKDTSGTIQVKSEDTGSPQRDDHSRGAIFFDAAKYPAIAFKIRRIIKTPVFFPAQAVEWPNDVRWDFTMYGVTRVIRSLCCG